MKGRCLEPPQRSLSHGPHPTGCPISGPLLSALSLAPGGVSGAGGRLPSLGFCWAVVSPECPGAPGGRGGGVDPAPGTPGPAPPLFASSCVSQWHTLGTQARGAAALALSGLAQLHLRDKGPFWSHSPAAASLPLPRSTRQQVEVLGTEPGPLCAAGKLPTHGGPSLQASRGSESAPAPSISSDHSYSSPHLPPPESRAHTWSLPAHPLWAQPAERLSSGCVLKYNLASGSCLLLQSAFKQGGSSFLREAPSARIWNKQHIVHPQLKKKKKKILGIYFSRNAQISHK